MLDTRLNMATEIKEIVDMEIYLEKYIKYSKIPDLENVQASIAINKDIRLKLYYKDIKKGKKIQEKVKELLKVAFGLNKIKLEELYNDGNSIMFYEILYEISKESYSMLYILGKIGR